MTIHNILGFCHANLCTNDYPYSYGFSSCKSLYEWISIFLWVFIVHIFVQRNIHIIMGFCHAHLCTNAYPYYYGFSLCTYFYVWLSILKWFFFMHIFVQTTIHVIMGFRHTHLCTNDYFVSNFFPMRFYKTGIFLCLLDF